MSDCVHDGWGEDPSVRGSSSDLSIYIVQYPHAHNRFDGWNTELYVKLECATDRVSGDRRYNNNYT